MHQVAEVRAHNSAFLLALLLRRLVCTTSLCPEPGTPMPQGEEFCNALFCAGPWGG